MRKEGSRVFLNTWEEYLDIPPNKLSSNSPIKIYCPVCIENGKKKEKSIYITPTGDHAKCFKCGTAFLKERQKVRVDSFTPPKRENLTELSEAGLQYLINRNISQEAIKHCALVTHKTYKDTIVFPYLHEKKLVNWKGRNILEKKFTQSEGGMRMVFNYDNALGKRIVIIHEGEIDTLSSVTSIIKHGDIDEFGCVSLDLGAPGPNDTNVDNKLKCITNSYELYEMAERVIIAVDDDEPGQRLQRELIRRLPPEKIYIVSFGELKDANAYLHSEGSEKLYNMLLDAKPYTPESIITIADVESEMMDMYDNGLEKGTTTYYPSIDRMWRWRLTETNIWTGYNNEGKSQIINELSLVKCLLDGWPIGAYTPENMPPQYFYEHMVHVLCGKTTDKDRSERLPRELYIKAIRYLSDKIFVIAPESGRAKLPELLEQFKFLIYRRGVRIINIDPLMKLIPQESDRADYYASDFMGELGYFAKSMGVAINLVAHQRDPERDKDGLNFKKPNLYRIKGGGTFADAADNVLVVHRPNRASDPKDPGVDLYSDKIRFEKLVAPKGTCSLEFDWRSQQYIDPGLPGGNPLRKLWADMNHTPVKDDLPF